MKPDVDYPELREPVDEARLAHNLRALRGKQDKRRLWRVSFAASACTMALCALALLVHGAWRGSDPTGAARIASAEARRCVSGAGSACAVERISFDDGSQIILAPTTRLAVVTNDAHTIHSVLHRGWARFSVQPGGPRRWLVDAGSLRIEVVGTSFTVLRTPSSVRVHVHHGRVLVHGAHGPNEKVLLSDGEQLDVPALAGAAIAPRPSAEVLHTPPQENAPPLPAKPSRPKNTQHEAERAAAPAEPPLSVLTRADELRAAGDDRGACGLLREALTREPHGSQRGLVAFTLAQLLLDTQDQPDEAGEAFSQALSEPGLPSSLREQTLARTVEAFARADRPDAARSARDEYLRAYPKGRWASAMVRWAPLE